MFARATTGLNHARPQRIPSYAAAVTKVVERTFDRTPRELVDGMMSPEYLAARSAALGGTDPATVERDGDVVVVRFPRRLPMDDLGPLRKFAGTGDVVQVERWDTIADDRCHATWETESALPGKVSGTFEVLPAPGGGATYRVTATAKVSIPLIGGRISGEVEGHVERLVVAEMDFAEKWLAAQS
jgi:hypothetical protein